MPPVRESRHLWVGNIPDTVSQDKLVEHFERYGRIDSIKLLNKRSADGGLAAFVDFVDIRCAIKAHQTPNRLGDRELRTDYNEPASTTLARTHVEPTRRYGGRGPGGEGYNSRQADSYSGNYSYKDNPPPRREYDRVDEEQAGSRGPEESGPQYRRQRIKSKADSDSGQSGSGSAGSGSGSDSSDSGDSDSDSESGSSASEPSRSSGKKTTALQIRNLSGRSADATIREGLYHEFKKHGEVGQIKVFGSGPTRYAIVYFRRHENVMKAMESCRGKMFLGLEMDLTPYEDDHYEGSFHRYRRRNEPGGGGGGGGNSFGAADDVFLFNATRTIFVGNIERNTTSSELKRMFERYGEIVDIDIKKQGSNGAYAFIQFLDITHAVEAKKQMNRVSVGRTRLKIGFGKGMPTSTLWIGGLPPSATEQTIERHFEHYGRLMRVGLDRQRSYAMVTFDNIDSATLAHNDAKDRPVFGKRVRVDYASRESQHFFYENLDRTGQGDGRRFEPSPPPTSTPSYRQRGGGGNKGYDEPPPPPLRSRGGGPAGMKPDGRGSKYHGGGYEPGYERGPAFSEGSRGGGRGGYYDDYYHRGGSARGGGYESDDFGQELREYNVTRERERAREREQDRRQGPPPPPRRHGRERHEIAATESDSERPYYGREQQHSDTWPGESGKDRASRESSFEPRETEVQHRSTKGDTKRRDVDKRRGEDKKGFATMKRYEGQQQLSEEELERAVLPPAERSGSRREKTGRKKVPDIRGGEDDAPPQKGGDFYAGNYQKSFPKGDSKEKEMAPLKRKVKVEKDFLDGPSAEDGKLLPEDITVKIDNVIKDEKAARVCKEERGSVEKVSKKMKKEGKKKRKHKKSPDAPGLAPMAALPTQDENPPEAMMDSDGVIEKAGFEARDSRVSTKVDKGDVIREKKKERKGESVVMKSVVVDKNTSEGSDREPTGYRGAAEGLPTGSRRTTDREPRNYRQDAERRPKSPEVSDRDPRDYRGGAEALPTGSRGTIDREPRNYRQGGERRPKSPSPEDLVGEEQQRVSRKRARSPARGGSVPEQDSSRVESTRAKNAKHTGDSRGRSNGAHDYEEVNQKKVKGRISREATPPPPPPPPLPKPAASAEPRSYPKQSEGFSANPPATDASTGPQANVITDQHPITARESQSMFQPYPTTAELPIPSVGTKHETRAQTLSHPSPTNSPAPAQTGSSTVPNSDDTLMELLRRHPVMWQGLLGLKNDSAAIQMHYVSGNSKLAEYSLPKPNGGTGANGLPIPPVLRIAQRMRMEASQLEGVTKRMQLEKEHCLLLALPCGRDPLDVHAQTRALKNGFIAYLQQKLAAGIINIAQPGSQQASFVLHVFPPCEFSHSHLSRVAPNLLDSATDSGHLMVVVATV